MFTLQGFPVASSEVSAVKNYRNWPLMSVFLCDSPCDVCLLSTDSRMSKNSKVLNLKDKISGNEVDLSLCNLTEVPVRELVSYSAASKHTVVLHSPLLCCGLFPFLFLG